MGSEAYKLQSRLLLTGRFKVCLPAEAGPSAAMERLCEEAAADRCSSQLPELWGHFRRNPPTLSMAKGALRLGEESSEYAPEAKKEGVPVLTLLMQLLDDEDSEICAVTRRGDAEEAFPSREDRPHLLQATLAIRQLIWRLVLQSVESRQRDSSARALRLRNMGENAWDRKLRPLKLSCRQATDDAADLVAGSDFLPLAFGAAERDGSHKQLGEDADATLLRVRMVLRTQPFFAYVSGAAHIGALLRLAMFKNLHLELLPCRQQLDAIKRSLGDDIPQTSAAFQILVEVSCQPTTELQYKMRNELWCRGSEQEEETPALIRAAALRESDPAKLLGAEITQRRRSGVPVMIESSTDDLVKVFQMLYMVSATPSTDGSVAKTKRFRKKVKPAKVIPSALPSTDLRDPMLSQAMSSNWAALKKTVGATGAGRAHSQLPDKSGDEPMRTLPGPVGTSVEVTQVLAMDCEMVGVGRNGERSALARVAVVNNDGNVLLDEYVATKEAVTDYRTKWSGIRPIHLADAPPFEAVVARVAALLDKRTLVGHALHNDLHVLLLSHPSKDIRDTARYPPLMRAASLGRKPKPQALRVLAAAQLGLVIQEGEHTPVDDARAALYLYHKHTKEWEAAVKGGRSHQGASANLNAQGCKVVSRAGERLRLRKVAGVDPSESGKVPPLAAAGVAKSGGKGTKGREGRGGAAAAGGGSTGLSNYLQYDVRNDPMADL
ncbi:MAG: hypothetical protein WDW36_009635 [Sanguina aurantia]